MLSPSLSSRPRLNAGPVAALVAIGLGVAVGAAVTLASPLLVLAAVLGLAVALALLSSVRLGLLALIAVAMLLPFAVLPARLAVQPTFLDAALGTLLGVWLLRAARRRASIHLSAAGPWLLAFVVVACAAFVLGGGRLAPDELTRKVLKLLASALLFFCVLDEVGDVAALRQCQRLLIGTGALAAALAAAVWALPAAGQVRLLSALGPLGYPTGNAVLRYIPGPNNTYTDTLRAVGTAIDPNVLGGMLLLATVLAAGHLLGERPLAPRPLLAAALAVLAVGLALSYSRSAWVGVAVGGAYLACAARRSRRVPLLGVLAAALLLASPFGQSMLGRLASGFAAQDRASALRLREYANAVAIVERYPLLGIGFGAAPDLDLQEGVSSLYLTLAEQTGLLGMTLYLLAVGAVLAGSFRAPRPADPGLATSRSALQATLVAVLVAGLFDHYFVNKDFPHMVALFWLCVGLLAASTRMAAPTSDAPAAARSISMRGTSVEEPVS